MTKDVAIAQMLHHACYGDPNIEMILTQTAGTDFFDTLVKFAGSPTFHGQREEVLYTVIGHAAEDTWEYGPGELDAADQQRRDTRELIYEDYLTEIAAEIEAAVEGVAQQ